MSDTRITPAIQLLHRLAWQPGALMHSAWWSHLGFGSLQDCYSRHAQCRAPIDRLIVSRRGYPVAALPTRLDARQTALLGIESRLPKLIIALGLIALDSADYLLVKSYREHLLFHLGQRGCEQLLAVHRGWHSRKRVSSPADVVSVALSVGVRWWQRDATSCITATLLTSKLPPPLRDISCTLPDNIALDKVLKIDRFL
jgi:hypothetical protein